MKLTESIIDQLIAEQIEKLDEKTSFFPKSDLDKSNVKDKLKVKVSKGLKDTDKPDGIGTPENWLKLAGLDGDGDDLSLQDILLAYRKGADFEKLVDYLFVDSLGDADAKTVTAISKIANLTNIDTSDLNFKDATDVESIQKIFDKYQSEQGREQGVGTVELPYRTATVDKDWKDGEDLTTAKAIPQASISVFRKGMQDAGGNLIQYFQNLSEIGDALRLAAGSTDANLGTGKFKDENEAKTFLEGMPPDELFNTATLLKTLGVIAKEVQGASAGTIFETFLALMMGGAIFGGEGAAADVIAGNKGQRKFSAKQYAGKPGGEQASLNFMNEADDKGETIWYICMAKMGVEVPNPKKRYGKTVKDFTRLDIYITGIKYTGEDNAEAKKQADNYTCVDSTGTPFTTLDGNDAFKKVKWKIKWQEEPNIKIPISTAWADTSSIASFDKLFVDAIDGIQGNVKKAIKDMNVMLARLNDQTKIYIADKSADAAKSIGEDYDNLKATITGGIGQIGDDSAKQQFKAKSGLQENKNNLENILDKLIQEVILTK